MISKKSPPPRPPLPASRKKAEPAQQRDEQNAQKKPSFLSIHYSRDDANESDEEISIIRKDSLPDLETEIKNEIVESTENGASSSGGPSSILAAVASPFLSKTPTIGSGSEASNVDEPSKHDTADDSVGEIVFKTTHFEQEASSSPSSPDTSSNGRHSTSPPAHRRKENPIISSKMSLSSLLKKGGETPFAKGSSSAECSNKQGTHTQLPMAKGFLASALAGSSRLLMPIGLGDLSSGVGDDGSTDKQDELDVTYTDIPLYNMLLVAVVVFLYFMLPSSSFMNGFVVGGILTFFVVFALMWLLTPEMSDEERYKRDVLEHEHEMKMLRKKMSSESYQLRQLCQQSDLEGWFFKASSYNPLEPVDFNDPEQIQPVYVCLSAYTMTFYNPKEDDLHKVKRSSMLGQNENIQFSDSKTYNLSYGGEIELAPDTLTMKRLWAKKYPIHLKLFEKQSSEGTTEDHEGSQETFVLPSDTEEMYMFSPTGRAKEEWYYRIEKILKPRTHAHFVGDIESIFGAPTSFPKYMEQLIGAEREPTSQAQLTWVNALLGRLFWDVWKSEYWNNKVKSRIQNKISRMKLPPFIRYLKVTDLKLGHALPTIQRAHNLHQDNRGIWVDLDVDYEGGIMLTIETMVNLEYYLKQLTDMQGKNESDEVILKFSREDYSDVSSTESDVEGESQWDDAPDIDGRSPSVSSEGSGGENSDAETDGERRSISSTSTSPTSEQDKQGWAGKVKNPKGKKILNMLEKVAKSKWVQKAAETKVVQKAVEKFSNLPIELGVEVARLRGTLAANIPPPPTNRLWLGFHSNPLLSLIARPKLGERNVRLTHVTEWIELKLKQEFKTMFVLPNMEDLAIRIMDSGLEEKFSST